MNKRTYYEVKVPTMTSKKGKIARLEQKMLVEVVITEHNKGIPGLCQVTPVAGYGTIGVKSKNLKLL